MSNYLIAQNLNTSSEDVAAAVMGADGGWLRDLAFRLSHSGVDALDLCVRSLCPAADTEVQLLDWAAQQVEFVSELPLFLDSPRPEVLESCREHRRSAPTLNSVSVEQWEAGVLSPQSGEGCVVQLRRGDELPSSTDDRLNWTEAALRAAETRAIDPGRLFIDPVCLAWGENHEAGEPLLSFLAEATRRWPGLRLLVAVGNLSWGHPGRVEIEREWTRRLVEHGANAFLLNALDSQLIALARA